MQNNQLQQKRNMLHTTKFFQFLHSLFRQDFLVANEHAVQDENTSPYKPSWCSSNERFARIVKNAKQTIQKQHQLQKQNLQPSKSSKALTPRQLHLKGFSGHCTFLWQQFCKTIRSKYDELQTMQKVPFRHMHDSQDF